jgi:hypothetical protein
VERHGGLGQAESARGREERAFAQDGAKRQQVAKIHRGLFTIAESTFTKLHH